MEIEIHLKETTLKGILLVPKHSSEIVLFAHGSGSSRLSARNQFVANILQDKNLGTLLFDLLTHEEEKIDLVTSEIRFDINHLTRRLIETTDWVESQENLKPFKIGYFGSGTATAATLKAAAQKPKKIHAVVSRGGRPDLAKEDLEKVKAPTLLIVKADDTQLIELNKTAFEHLHCEKKLEFIEGGTNSFEESKTLEEVAKIAAEWFTRKLS